MLELGAELPLPRPARAATAALVAWLSLLALPVGLRFCMCFKSVEPGFLWSGSVEPDDGCVEPDLGAMARWCYQVDVRSSSLDICSFQSLY
jgi:hypothetical protein